MPRTYTYTFSTPADSTVTVTTEDDAEPIDLAYGAQFLGYKITNISGTFAGHEIISMFGPSGTNKGDRPSFTQDNAIFINQTQGARGGSYDGIDMYGISFLLDNNEVITIKQNRYSNGLPRPGLDYSLHRTPTSTTANSPDLVLESTNYAPDPCFVSGTSIRTTRGEVEVERLAAGDLVVTASGALRPIRWLGHRTIDCRRSPCPAEARPVRIAAHAFGQDLPARDLYLSPGHPVLVGADEDGACGHLVPIMCLINGTTIARVPVDTVTYWHVELDEHDILLAEGLPAESYLDWGDRAFFTEGADHALANPDFVVPGLAGRCRPVALDGQVVEAERRRLGAVFAMGLAEACAWPDAGEDAIPAAW